jgi:hypothetical protein
MRNLTIYFKLVGCPDDFLLKAHSTLGYKDKMMVAEIFSLGKSHFFSSQHVLRSFGIILLWQIRVRSKKHI